MQLPIPPYELLSFALSRLHGIDWALISLLRTKGIRVSASTLKAMRRGGRDDYYLSLHRPLFAMATVPPRELLSSPGSFYRAWSLATSYHRLPDNVCVVYFPVVAFFLLYLCLGNVTVVAAVHHLITRLSSANGWRDAYAVALNYFSVCLSTAAGAISR